MGSKKSDTERLDRILERRRELTKSGLDNLHASSRAFIESLIDQLPERQGDNLRIIIYGDFEPPSNDLRIESLGITVYPKIIESERNVIPSLFRRLEATVEIYENSYDGLIDVAKRVNILLGAFQLVTPGTGSFGWWSYFTHDTGAGAHTELDNPSIPIFVEYIFNLPEEISKRIEGALYWIRDSNVGMMEFYRKNQFREFSSYWNAFECLVEAAGLIVKPKKLTSKKKQTLIDNHFATKDGKVLLEDIIYCYDNIINYSFKQKARHALYLCCGKYADDYFVQCFSHPDKKQRLVEIRNAINHGRITVANRDELLRVESRFTHLHTIVRHMMTSILKHHNA